MNAEDLVITFKRDMAKLSGTERRRAIESVRDVIRAAEFDDAAGSAYEVERCPRCGSAAVVKKGKSRNGEQRYLCRGCGRTFGMGSGRILRTSRLPRETWMAYAECFVLMLPLRECARRCRVCLKTAYTMRHRLIECLSAYTPSFKVERGCGCELDETYLPESFKGNHAKGSFAMPRPSRHRGKQVRRRGLSLERICVMTGVNDSGETFLEVSGRGALSRERAMGVLRGRIASGSVVATDRAAAYVGVLAELGVAACAAYDPKDRSGGDHQPGQHRPFAPRRLHGAVPRRVDEPTTRGSPSCGPSARAGRRACGSSSRTPTRDSSGRSARSSRAPRGSAARSTSCATACAMRLPAAEACKRGRDRVAGVPRARRLHRDGHVPRGVRHAGGVLPEGGGGAGGGRARHAGLPRLSADPLEAPAHRQRAGEDQPGDKAQFRRVQVFPSTGSLVRLAGAVMCEQDEVWQGSRYFSEARMNEPCDDGRTRGIDGPVDWTRLEAEARKMLESGLELADRLEAA